MPDTCSHIFQGSLSLKLNHQPDSCVLLLYRYLVVPDSMFVDPFPKSPIVVAHYHHLYFCWHLIIFGARAEEEFSAYPGG